MSSLTAAQHFHQRIEDLAPAAERRLPLLGALNAVGFLSQYVGQCWTTPARTALLVNSNVFVVGIVSYFVFRERFTVGKVVAVGVAFAGIALLSLDQGQPGACGTAWWGDAVVLAGAIAWSFYIIAYRKAVRDDARFLPIAAWTFVATSAVLAPTLAFAQAPLAVPAQAIAPILYAGIVTTVLTYVLWSYGLARVSATVSSVIVLAEVPVAVLISLALGRESFRLASAIGGAIFFAAVAYVSLKDDARASEPAPAEA